MSVTFSNVAAAYAQISKNSAKPGMEASEVSGDFSSLLKGAATQAVNTLQQGEAASVMGLAGKLDLSQVVTAVSNAEVTLQAATAVRDRVVQSYLEILRMPI